jgi:hypothetical protein
MMDPARLDEALRGLRGFRRAGEQYANRGGSILPLDYHIDIALDEIEWRRDPASARDDELERPDEQQIALAMAGFQPYLGDGCLGEDLQTVHDFLEQPELFSDDMAA